MLSPDFLDGRWGWGDKNIPYFIVYIRRLPMEMRSHFNFIGLIVKAKKFFTLPGRKLLVTLLTPTPVALRWCKRVQLHLPFTEEGNCLENARKCVKFQKFASPRCAQKSVEIYGAYRHLRFTLF